MEKRLGWDADIGKIELSSHGILTASDLAPLIDDLTERYLFVDANISRMTPPAAGWSEIALYLTPVGIPASIYAASFIASWAGEDAKALRAKLLELLRKGRVKRDSRTFIPLCIHIGRARFYFHKPLTDEELVKRLRAAREYVAALPDEAFAGSSGPGEYGLAWDEATETWQGQVFQINEGAEFIQIHRYMVDD